MPIQLLEKTMRWYGPKDPVELSHIKQAGASGVVTALHHIANGEIWVTHEILKRKNEIESAGLSWSVVESLPVHEEIKFGGKLCHKYLENYRESLKNLASCGIKTVCYNFMPLLDWTRTQLDFRLPGGSKALRFEKKAVIAFDLFILQRPGAEADYSKQEVLDAEEYFKLMGPSEKSRLTENILKGLPGSELGFTLEEFKNSIAKYDGVTPKKLADNLNFFLKEVVQAAIDNDIHLCIHPDDPPFPIFGLPRVVSTAEDIRRIFNTENVVQNGLTFCSGSFGVRADNNLPEMVREFGDRIHFIHLRSTKRDLSGNFYEADHLEGDVPMYEVMKELVSLQQKRAKPLPMRPDHGHQMLDDLEKTTAPGYAAIGRLKGLAELKGLEMGIAHSIFEDTNE